ncbi:MAG: ferric reductase-like transmembrane domain-containing protein [Patescibacteria group bacterium]|nr:ferric reductase-like transmembrane domain-containing protein [Patescibacteria group bacterium]
MKTHRRIVPLIIAFAATNAAVIVYFWWLGSNKFLFGTLGQQLIALGRLSGLSLVFFVLLQILLIGRIGWLEKTFGFDKLARLHHGVGFSLVILLLAHPFLLSFGYALRSSDTIFRQFLGFLAWEDVMKAFIATCLFILIIVISALTVLKKLKYETWYFIHLIIYFAILLAFGHQLAVGRSLQDKTFAVYWVVLYAFVVLNLLYYRFFLPLLNHLKHSFRIEKVEYPTADCVSIYLSGNRLERFRFAPGQFAIFRFLAKGFWHEAHPFSFSLLPDGRSLRITVKDLGDYTGRMKNLKPGTPTIIDGPLGIFTLHRRTKDKILLIAGGVGITPIRALAEDAVKKSIDTVMLYGGRDTSSLVLKNELDGLAASKHLRTHYVLSHQEDWGGEKGFIDDEKISRLVPDFADRDLYLCGPAPMLKTVLSLAKQLRIPKDQIHFEKFSL